MKLNSDRYTLQLVVRGVLSLLLATATALMSTQYKMSGSTPVMSKVKGASQVRQITCSKARFLLMKLLTAAGVPTRKVTTCTSYRLCTVVARKLRLHATLYFPWLRSLESKHIDLFAYINHVQIFSQSHYGYRVGSI